MAKTISATQALAVRHKTIQLSGAWGDCVGEIDRTGIVFIWGQSGNGKSSAAMSLAKELTKHGKVLYVPLEEGLGLSFQNTMRRCAMYECGRKFQVIEHETMDELSERLTKRKSPDFVIIDSFQYTQMTYKEYISFKEANADKLIIFISHADGRQPAGRAAVRVKYDASLKLWVEGYKVFSNGRFYGSTGEYTIWPEQADIYWGIKNSKK